MFFQDFRLDRELLFIEKRGDAQHHELHMHDVLEYHILLENEARFQLTDRQYEGKPGDVFLFRPFEPHWNLVKHPDRPIRWISILFYPSVVRSVPGGYTLLAPFYAVEAVSPHIPASDEAAGAIHRLASQALTEEQDRAAGWEARQFILFIDILIRTLRHAVGRMHDGDGNGSSLRGFGDVAGAHRHISDESIFQAIAYLLAHFTEEVDIDELVRMSGRRRTYFYRDFKAVTGVSPNGFIHRLRMQVALYLLARTDRPVTDIAFECGYSSVAYFITHFRQYKGTSPGRFRKQAQQSLRQQSGRLP